MQDLGFRVQGAGFGVQSSGSRFQGAGFRVQGSGFRVQDSGPAHRPLALPDLRVWTQVTGPPWRQPRSKLMVSLVNSHTNASSKRWNLWEIDLRFALDSTLGWCRVEQRSVASPASVRPRSIYYMPYTIYYILDSVYHVPYTIYHVLYTIYYILYILHALASVLAAQHRIWTALPQMEVSSQVL